MPSRKSKREVIHIQMPTYTTNAYNQKTVTGYTNVVENVRATWIHTAGSETARGRQVEPSVVGIFEIRKPPADILPNMAVLHVVGNDYVTAEHVNVSSDGELVTTLGEKRYEIHSVRPSESKYEGGFRDVEILVKAIANG